MDEAHAHPAGHQPRGALANLGEPVGVQRLALPRQVREIARDAEVRQSTQQVDVAAHRRQLEMAETQERGRDPADDGPGLDLGMAVVEHVADHALAGADQAQRPRGRDAEVVHRLAAQELADRGAQHRATVGAARIRGRPGAFQLQLAALAIGQDRLAQRDRPAIAQLPGPVAELVATIVGREGLHARQQGVAAEYLGKFGRGNVGFAEAKLCRHFRGMGQEAWRFDRSRLDRGPQRRLDLARKDARLGVAGHRAQERVVEGRQMHATS